MKLHGADLRPHAYEVFVLVNLILTDLFLRSRGSDAFLKSIPAVFDGVMSTMIAFLFAGVAGRVLLGVVTGRPRAYLRYLGRPSWWIESVRLLVFGGFALLIYTTLKVLLPLAGGSNADARLWAADTALLFGHSPSVLFLELFSYPPLLRVIDWGYENLFLATLYVVIAIALSSPSQRLRVALVGAKSSMWITGAWLYYTMPSLGPAYRFPEVWDAVAANMPRTRALLAALFSNFLLVVGRRTEGINVWYGIAAFPSLHVALHTLAALWARRFSALGGALATVSAILIFIGSIVTGWHYLVDSIAGVVLAIIFYLVFFRLYHLSRWVALLKAVRGDRRTAPTRLRWRWR